MQLLVVRIASLVATAKLNGVNPNAYLKATFEVVACADPSLDIDPLMPRAFTPTSSSNPGGVVTALEHVPNEATSLAMGGST
ncbi:transposase domain-containing protein [Candidatus Rariloculus sp.]|uniref:transposase domain-containing protein n=1 Tax=Candidatus Rariloculus sp. TaxID=3101265 RepID=UPI003D0C4092